MNDIQILIDELVDRNKLKEELAEEGNFVETYTGGWEWVVPHPSQQVKRYHELYAGFC